MLVGPAIATATSSAIILVVASQCARNMIQTAGIRRDMATLEPESMPSLESGSSPADSLRGMNRKDLLRVFASSRAPTAAELKQWFSSDENNDDESYCEWDGELLDNNGAFMTLVSKVVTHGLFGGIGLPWRLVGAPRKTKGHWNGKAFAKPEATGTSGRGINRFVSAASPSGFRRHVFEYEITKSDLLPGEGSESLKLDYSKHQSFPTSIWGSMRDELRVVELPLDSNSKNGEDKDLVLIGMGSMAWSGGPLNCSPFLLERCRRK